MIGQVDQHNTLAMAALLQAGQSVVELAQTTSHDKDALAAVASSVLQLKESDTASIFGGQAALRPGLELIRTLFRATPTPAHKELIRYVVSMAQLSVRLKQSPMTEQHIATGIENILSSDVDIDGDDYYLALGQLYQETLSRLEPKIMVRGTQGRLESIETVSRVRAALFGGVRAAYLWHQLGGKRWHLMFMRKRYVAQAQNLLRV